MHLGTSGPGLQPGALQLHLTSPHACRSISSPSLEGKRHSVVS